MQWLQESKRMGQASPAASAAAPPAAPCTLTARGSSWSKLPVDPHSSNALMNGRHSVWSQRARAYHGTWPQRVQCWFLGKRHRRAPGKHQPHSTSGTGKALLILVQLELAQELLRHRTATILQFYRIQQAGQADIQTFTASGRCFS